MIGGGTTQFKAPACAWPTTTKGQGKHSGKKETFNTLGDGGRVHCRSRAGQGTLPSGGGGQAQGRLQRGGVWAGLEEGGGQRWPGTTAAGTSARGLSRTARSGVRGPTMWPPCPPTGLGAPPLVAKLPGGWLGRAAPQLTPHRPRTVETPASESGTGVAWVRPPTFQRFPHSLQTTNVVMGSSELRVCTCGRCGKGATRGAPATPTFQLPDRSPLIRPHVSWV